MPPTMKDLGIDRLSSEQRVALALEIWESLGEARPVAHLTVEQCAELSRRNAELNANPGIAMTWEQIRASIEVGLRDCREGRTVTTAEVRRRLGLQA